MDVERPKPEALLAHAQSEERRQRSGRLRIFLGYAAGVGKTYAMLQAAREELAKGRRVLIAYVETHGRPETEALLEHFAIIPRKQVPYRDVALEEMDLDTVLAEHPNVALVDELAHTNAPGSRHTRRYQDVEELLEVGIDVFTTLNIQHVESVNDIVAQITGVSVRETVPDHIIETADEIGLVDLPPDELIERLREGKVYVPDQASRAIEKFFRPGNLTALRELALRYLAGTVDHQMRNYMGAHAITGPWPARERVLVCIDADPLGERLVRTGRRLAAGLDAEWIVLHVETSESATLSEDAQERIDHTMRLAEELGATTVTIPGTSASEAIIEYARAQNVTKILVGVSHHPRWMQLIRGSVVDRIIHASGAMDVYVISAPVEPQPGSSTVPSATHRPISPWPYLYSAGVIGLVTGATALLRDILSPTNLAMPYLLALIVIALQWGRGPAALAAVLSGAVFDFLFVPPYFSFWVANTGDLLTVVSLLVVGLVVGTLASRSREQAEAARRRETYTAALAALSGELAATSGLDEIMRALTRHIAATFTRRVAIFLPGKDGDLQLGFATPDIHLNENERGVATWVFRHGQPAGYGTDTLPAAAARYVPLKTAQHTVGVLGVQPMSGHMPLTSEQRRLLEAFANQGALAIERARLVEEARQGEITRETERLQSALLSSISHDLRTPLASITGALSSLVEAPEALDDAARQELLETAKEEVDRLNRLVGNLLDMNRLEGGALKLHVEPGDVEDLIGTALSELSDAARHRDIRVTVPPDLALIPMDFALMAQAVANLLDNAVKYSSEESPIEVRVEQVSGEVQIRVEDRGRGIPPDDLGRVFDKFYRIQHHGTTGGVGLGLAISKGIVEAHGGRIWAENRPEDGTTVVIALPVRSPATERTGEVA